MSGYSGDTSFDFEIERYKDKESGKLYAYLLPQQENNDFEYEYQVITLKVEGQAYYQRGRTYGPPEDCYPDEGDAEITSLIGPDGADWSDQLTSTERDALIEEIQNRVIEGCEPDYDY